MIDVGLDRCEPFAIKNGLPCSIEKFEDDDLEAIASIENRASLFPWSKENFADSVLSSHICVGVKCKTQWIAHAVFSLAADEAELLILAVDPSFQGNHIATILLTQMELQLGTCANQLFLEVRASNHIAVGLYESLGYNCIGERRNYYPLPDKNSREDALIYGKYIGS